MCLLCYREHHHHAGRLVPYSCSVGARSGYCSVSLILHVVVAYVDLDAEWVCRASDSTLINGLGRWFANPTSELAVIKVTHGKRCVLLSTRWT